jgi:hypothetical protein
VYFLRHLPSKNFHYHSASPIDTVALFSLKEENLSADLKTNQSAGFQFYMKQNDFMRRCGIVILREIAG